MSAGAEARTSGWWRRSLRFCITLLLGLGLLTAATLAYLRWVDFPDFFKRRVQSTLNTRGLSVVLGRVRMRGLDLIADNVILSSARSLTGAQTVIGRLQISLDPQAMKRRQLQPRAVFLEHGELTWNLLPVDGPPKQIKIGTITAQGRLNSNDTFELTHLSGRVFGVQLQGAVILTNVSALRSWKFPRPTVGRARTQQRLDTILTQLEGVTFGSRALMQIQVKGDALNPASLDASLRMDAAQAEWVHGSVTAALLEAKLLPRNFDQSDSEVKVELRTHSGRYGEEAWQGGVLSARIFGSLTNRLLNKFDWQARLQGFSSPGIIGENITVTGATHPIDGSHQDYRTELVADAGPIRTGRGTSWTNSLAITTVHGVSPWDPWQARGELTAGPVWGDWGEVERVRFSGSVVPSFVLADWGPVISEPGPWEKLQWFEGDWLCEVDGVKSPQIEVEGITCAGLWHPPEVVLQELTGELYGGQFRSTGSLNVTSRELRSRAVVDFDMRGISQLLTAESRRWLGQFSWQVPPEVSAEVRLVLPVWTAPQPKWRSEVMPTIELAGEFSGRDGAFRGVPVAHASSHFTLTNVVWHLPDLRVTSPDGAAKLEYRGDMSSHEYRWQVEGSLSPKALVPLLEDERAQRVLDEFEFSAPPMIQGRVSGRWHEPQSIWADGRISVTNFVFRGERCTELSGTVRYTNLILQCSDVTVSQDAQRIVAPWVNFDILEQVIDVTNAVSTMDPDLVTRVIGPKVRAAVRPYRFGKPPTVRVNGRVPTVNTEDADLHFQVSGEAFDYWRLHLPAVTGDVWWRGDSLSITNVRATFYGGRLTWQGDFDFSVPVGAILSFQGHVFDADLRTLMADIGRKTNNLQGALEAHVLITSANSDDWRSWQGLGEVRLRNGFLWEIPIFGFFSPMLNKIVPKLGSSPISAGHATFRINDSVVHTDDLELKSPALRLRYTGDVDLRGAVKARTQAEILRDTWGVGRLVSLALWPISKVFQYRVSGTIYHPKAQPVYIPKALLWPLHPIRTLKNLFTSKPQPAEAPAPAEEFLFPSSTE